MKVWVTCITGILAIGLGAFLIAPTTEGQQEFKDEPTVVKVGQSTVEEKAYSKEYKKLYASMTSERLTGLTAAERKSGVQRGLLIGKESALLFGTETQPIAQEFMTRMACRADAILLGTPTSRASHLTDDETFVYSQYEFHVKRVVKDNVNSAVILNERIPVTRPGGLVKVEDQIIRVEDRNFEQLRPGRVYLLFLRFVPAAAGYMMSEVDGDMLLDKEVLNGLSNAELLQVLGRNLPSKPFFEELELAVARGCGSISERTQDE